MELKAEWHPTLNLPLLYDPSLPVSKKYWWQGKCSHEWQTSIKDRLRYGCPYCAGKKILLGFNDFASQNPGLLVQWHPTKNIYSPYEITPKTRKKVWWFCSKNHEWEATVLSRADGAGCPYCSGTRVLEGFNDLLTTHPAIAAQWHPIKNGNLLPTLIGKSSKLKVWWLGPCSHEWEAVVTHRTQSGTGCHYCSGFAVLKGLNDVKTLFPNLLEELHPTKNSPSLDLSSESPSSKMKVWWLGRCGHEWEMTIGSRAIGSGCHYCGGNKVLEGFNDLASQNPQLASEWHPTKNGDLTPRTINAKSGKKYWWLGKCGHEWQAQLSNRDSSGAGCSICVGKTVLAGFNDLASKMPALVSEWHPSKNGDLKPTQVTVSANMKLWWMCAEGHEWESRPNSRAKGAGCPTCAIGKQVSKAEKSLHDVVDSLDVQFETSNRSVLKGKEIDLWIPSKNVGIEFNGTYWHREKHRGKTLHHDKYLAAQKAGIQLIQIWEDDWNNKQDLVKQMLTQTLGVAEQLDAVETDVLTVTETEAEEFLNANHLQGFVTGSHYLGLVDKGDIENLLAVMVLEESPEDKVSLNIVRFAMSSTLINGFKKLLDYAMEAYSPTSFTVTADHCMSDGALYENNGFSVEKVLPPDYMYVVKNERKDKSEYPLERFHSDPKLLWEEGLTEMELADLNGLDRIWDAGKTCYRLVLQEVISKLRGKI